jgi:hypothetical protein
MALNQMVGIVLLLILSAASRANAADDAYASWLEERERELLSGGDPTEIALAAALRQHSCANDVERCFPDNEWHALAARGKKSKQPLAFVLLANTAAARHESDIPFWATAAAMDADNAYPAIMLATAFADTDQNVKALRYLDVAAERPRSDDYFVGMVSLVRKAFNPHLPTDDQLYRCAREMLPQHANSSEIENAVVFHVAVDIGLGPHALRLTPFCKQNEAGWDERRAMACNIAGHQLESSTSLLNNSYGLALQRFATRDAALKGRLEATQRELSDSLHEALWWTSDATDEMTRQQAISLWLDELSQSGEIAAGKALLHRFGPSPETPERRRLREQEYMTKSVECVQNADE